jgi:hypothetical protein
VEKRQSQLFWTLSELSLISKEQSKMVLLLWAGKAPLAIIINPDLSVDERELPDGRFSNFTAVPEVLGR